MRGDTLLFQQHHQAVAHLIVDNALPSDGALFQTIEGSCIVFVGYDQQIRIVGGKDLLGLAFIKLFFLFHNDSSSVIDMVTIPGTIRMRDENCQVSCELAAGLPAYLPLAP